MKIIYLHYFIVNLHIINLHTNPKLLISNHQLNSIEKINHEYMSSRFWKLALHTNPKVLKYPIINLTQLKKSTTPSASYTHISTLSNNYLSSTTHHAQHNMTKVYYISDLHTEFCKSSEHLEKLILDTIPIGCDEKQDNGVLVLAGDIGVVPLKTDLENKFELLRFQYFKRTFRIYKRFFTHIVFTAGNHSYYGCKTDMTYVDNKLNELCSELGVHYLQSNTVRIEKLLFIGCTLWSYITEEAYLKMNDSRTVFKDRADYNALNRKHTNWLISNLDGIESNDKVVVVTHHLPSYKLIHPIYKGSTINSGFANHLDVLFEAHQDKIQAWICGHTHKKINTSINDVPVLCNPLGYPGENNQVQLESITL